MNKKDKKRMQLFYDEAKHNAGLGTAESLNWNNKYNQQIRFENLIKIGILEDKTVLDLGSGYADLYFYIKKNSKVRQYLGLDIDSDFVSVANHNLERYTEASTLQADFMNIKLPFYDYIFASGSLNFNFPNAKQTYFELIKNMYKSATVGVSFNMLDKKDHVEDDIFLPYDKNEVEAFCKTFCKKVVINDSYLDHDFTVYLYRDDNV